MKRVSSLDNARALCVVWIVGFWHMIGYWEPLYKLPISYDNVCQIVTWTTLAAFTYFSGYFLGNKNITSFENVKEFFKRRLHRFYILFFISCTTLFLGGIILSSHGAGQLWFLTIKDYVYSLLGISTYVGNPPATLWYFCMLMSFYFITPVLLWKDTVSYKVSIGIIIECIIFLLAEYGESDHRNYLYFPFYLLGILKAVSPNKIPIKRFAICLMIYIIACILQFHYGLCNFPLLIIGESYIGIVLLVFFSEKLSLITSVNKYGMILSYSSMCAYLFHRQICGVLKILTPENYITPYLTSFVWTPCIFLLGLCIQKLYDVLSNKFSK